jgi:hypothetical protein
MKSTHSNLHLGHGITPHHFKTCIMKAITRAVYDFLDKRLGFYTNPHDVEIILDEDDAISVSCNWPGAPVDEPFFIELEYDRSSIDEFIKVFGITTVKHIGAIKPEGLMELYKKGKVVIFSAINTPPASYYSLHFRKQHDTITAKASNNEVSAVHALLETPKDFFIYTLQHFQLAGKS